MTESVHLLGLNQVDQLFRGLKETSMALARAPHGDQVYEHVEEPPALLVVPGGGHQHREDEAQAVRVTERSPVSLRNLAL